MRGLYQLDGKWFHNDEMTLVEVADGFLIDFLRHLEAPLDVFGIALVAKVALTAVVLEILEERLCEIGGMSLPCRLQSIFPSGRTDEM